MGRIVIIALAVSAVLGHPRNCLAGLYHRDMIVAPDVDDDGFAKALDIDTFLTMVNIVKKTDNPKSDAAEAALRSIQEREARLASLGPEEQIALAADMLRMRKDEAVFKRAMNLLQPLTRRPPDGLEFFVLIHQAYAHMRRPEFNEAPPDVAFHDAYTLADSALNDYEFPKKFGALSPSQLRWYRRLEKDYDLPFIRNRRDEARAGKAKSKDLLDPIFPGAKKGNGEAVRFVGEAGEYEAGSLAVTEKAKLPRDAIAIVQQMILWNPDDGRLWWLLAELYNAAGELKPAARVFKHLKDDELKYRHHETWMHEEAVLAVLETQRQAEEEKQRELEARKQTAEEAKRHAEDEYARKKAYVWVGIAVVVVLVGYWQARELARRLRSRRSKIALQARTVNRPVSPSERRS